MVGNYPVQAIDLPVRDDRIPENEDIKKEAANKADDARTTEIRKEDLGKEEVGKNVDETA